MGKVYDFLKQATYFDLATIDGDQPRVRPFAAVLEHDGKYYFNTSNQKDVYKQLKANPKLELSAKVDRVWLRVSGEAVFDNNDEVREKMLEAYPSLKNMYTVGDGIFEVFYLGNMEATMYSFTDEPKPIED